MLCEEAIRKIKLKISKIKLSFLLIKFCVLLQNKYILITKFYSLFILLLAFPHFTSLFLQSLIIKSDTFHKISMFDPFFATSADHVCLYHFLSLKLILFIGSALPTQLRPPLYSELKYISKCFIQNWILWLVSSISFSVMGLGVGLNICLHGTP